MGSALEAPAVPRRMRGARAVQRGGVKRRIVVHARHAARCCHVLGAHCNGYRTARWVSVLYVLSDAVTSPCEVVKLTSRRRWRPGEGYGHGCRNVVKALSAALTVLGGVPCGFIFARWHRSSPDS